MNKLIRKSTLSTVFLLCLVEMASAAEWSLTGNVNPSIAYDDNVFLSTNEKSSFHFSARPSLQLKRALENSSLTINSGYQIDRYSSISSNNTENPFFNIGGSYSTERSSYGVSASYSKNTSRSEALDNSGDFETQSILTSRSINPFYNYQLSERDSLALNLSYSKRDYSTTGFADNESKSMSVGWQRRFSERFSGGLTFSLSNYKSDGSSSFNDNDNYNVSTYLSYAVTELWTVSGNIGVRRLESVRTNKLNNFVVEQTSTAPSFNISASKSDQVNSYSIGLSKSVFPSSSGNVNDSERISASWMHKRSEVLSSNISASYQRTDSTTNNQNENRDNITFSSSINWQLQRNLGLSFSYNYRQQDRSTSESVDSNSFVMLLNYNWDGIHASR